MEFACPRCTEKLRANEDQIGSKFVCPTCTHTFLIPKVVISLPKASKANLSFTNKNIILLAVIGLVAIIFFGVLASKLARKSEPMQEAMATPVQTTMQTDNVPPRVKLDPETQLKRAAANLNTGLASFEEWNGVEYDIWKPKYSNNKLNGVICGNLRHFAGGTPTSLLVYKAFLEFRNGTWNLTKIIGKEMHAQPSSISSISGSDEYAIKQRLKEPLDNSISDEISIPKHIATCDELDTILHSDDLPGLQWSQFENRRIQGTGTIVSVESDAGTTYLVVRMHSTLFGQQLSDFEVTIFFDIDEKTKALSLGRGDSVSFSGEVGSFSTSDSKVYLHEGRIL